MFPSDPITQTTSCLQPPIVFSFTVYAVNSLFAAQEVASLQGRLGGTVNVEVDSMPGADLQKILTEIRDQYEDVIEKNREEAEALHKAQVGDSLAKQDDAMSQLVDGEWAICQHNIVHWESIAQDKARL